MSTQQSLSFDMNNFSDSGIESGSVVKEITWSPQQLACFDWVEHGKGSAIWIAVAGSGKTTTIEEATKCMGGYVTIVAYNVDIAKEIKQRVSARGEIAGQNIQCGTLHSFGLRAWRRAAPNCKIEGPLRDNVSDPRYQNAGYYKMDRIFEEMSSQGMPVDKPYKTFVTRLVSMMKQYGVRMVDNGENESELINWLIERYGFDDCLYTVGGEFVDGGRQYMIDKGTSLALNALEISKKLAYEVIDHEDMLYMAMSSSCRVFQTNWLICDEIQDLNFIMRAFLRKMIRPGGRFIGAGDPAQSIYAYSGAEADATHYVRNDFGCIDMPLTVSFRCAQSIVWEAQQYVSHIEAHEDVPLGDVLREDLSAFLKRADFCEDDVILCRKNAPLVDVAYSFIKRGIPCYVKGRDIGSGLIDLASRWSVVNLAALADRVTEYRRRNVAKLMAQKLETQAETLADKCDTMLALISGMPKGSDANALRARITSMFQDDNGNRKKCMVLSSVHKFKGKQAWRIFALGMNVFMPSPYARQDWQKDQEKNLMYVLTTRAQHTLIYVDMPVKGEEV